MSCGCANRLKSMLLLLGYELIDGNWVDKTTGDTIPESEISKHHTRIAAKVLATKAMSKFALFA